MVGNRSLSLQALVLIAGTGTAQILVAVLYILTARDIGPDEFGLVATSIALGLAFGGFADLGASAYWIRELASGRMSQNTLNPKMSTRLAISALLSSAIIATALLLDTHFIATGVLLLTSTSVLTCLVPLRAARRAVTVGWLTVLDRMTAVITYFILQSTGVPPGLTLWISLAVGDVTLIIYVFAAERSRIRLTLRTLSNPWEGSKWYSIGSLSGSAQQLDLPILAASSGTGAAGIYGGVNRWIQPLVLAVGAFSSAVAPIAANERDLHVLRRSVLRAGWILALAVVINICVILAAPWIVETLLGPNFAGSTEVLRWLAAAMILNTVAQPLIVALQSRQYDHFAARVLLGSVCLQLVLVAALAPTLGALSAGIGFFASQALQLIATCVCIAVILRRRRRHR